MATNKNISKMNKSLLEACENSDLERALQLMEQGADPGYGFRGGYVLNELFFEAPIEYLEKVFGFLKAPIKSRKGLFTEIISYFRPAQEQTRIIELMLKAGATVDPDDVAQSVISALQGFPSATDKTDVICRNT
jgi:CBS domain-containing protein